MHLKKNNRYLMPSPLSGMDVDSKTDSAEDNDQTAKKCREIMINDVDVTSACCAQDCLS